MTTTLLASPSNIELYLKEKRALLETTLAELVPEQKDLSLFEAARYSLFSPAKRLRPLLTILSAETLGANPMHALYPACAIEMLHTYSLIHDDLPCMDDDDMRRGLPTLHKVYPEGHAVLTGDFLLTYSFEILSRSPHLTPQQCLELIRSLTTGAGALGMIGGQALDLTWARSNVKPSWTELSQVQSKKTAALFSSALEMGAIVANGSESDRSLLVCIGKEIGLAFQIVDDILDGDGTVALLGIEQAKELVQKLHAQVETHLSKLSSSGALLQAFFEMLVHRVI